MRLETIQQVGIDGRVVRDRKAQPKSDAKLFGSAMGVIGGVAEKIVNIEPSLSTNILHIGEAGVISAVAGYGVATLIRWKDEIWVYRHQLDRIAQDERDSAQYNAPQMYGYDPYQQNIPTGRRPRR